MADTAITTLQSTAPATSEAESSEHDAAKKKEAEELAKALERRKDKRCGHIIVAVGSALVALVLLLILQLWSAYEKVTTETTDAGETASDLDVSILWAEQFTLSGEVVILLIVGLCGVLGGTLTGIRNAARHLGIQDFKRHWVGWYVIRPFLGAGIAVVLYFSLVGGLLGVGADTSNINRFGVAGLSVLAGMFSKDAITKLGELFNEVFASAKTDRDSSTRAERLRELKALHDEDVLNDAEYKAAKAKVLD